MTRLSDYIMALSYKERWLYLQRWGLSRAAFFNFLDGKTELTYSELLNISVDTKIPIQHLWEDFLRARVFWMRSYRADMKIEAKVIRPPATKHSPPKKKLCSYCRGSGKARGRPLECKTCNGRGYTPKEVTVYAASKPAKLGPSEPHSTDIERAKKDE